MKIVLDPQIFNDQKFGGISRYFAEIYKYIKTEDSANEIELPLIFSENFHIKDSIENKHSLFYFLSLKFPFFKKKYLRKTKKKNIKLAIKILQMQDYDVVVPTYYNPYFIDLIGNKPFVLTVYDMIHEVFPQYFLEDLYTVKNKKILIEKANKIIVISESTKKDIIKFYPDIDATKIEIIYLAQSIDTINSVKVDLPKKYILFVGNRDIYKNFIFFIKAIASTLRENRDLFVVCAGGNHFHSKEKKLLEELDIFKQVIQQNFEDNELSYYYSNAQCFVFPSEYEGFGIPVLESMACGCPVILANHSSFPEVAGDAGVYFELNNELDLKNKIVLLLNDESYRTQIIQKGYLQVAKFSWKKTAQECLALFEKTVKEC